MAVKDSRNTPLQFNFFQYGVHMLSNKRLDQLNSSDEGLFREHILPLIPIDSVRKLYSEKTGVRPASYAINHVAAAIFVRLTGLSEEEFLEQLPWNMKYQYALGIDQWTDSIAFGQKTFSNLRNVPKINATT